MRAIIMTMITMISLIALEDSRATKLHDSKAPQCLEIADAIKELWYRETDIADNDIGLICLDGFLEGDEDEAGHVLCTQFIKECGL